MSKDIKIRWGWLRLIYVYTIVTTGLGGLGFLFAPQKILSLLGAPAMDPIILGTIGSFTVTFGLFSILGLWSPLKFSPVLFFQLCYKCIWFLAVVLPLVVTGAFPKYLIHNCVWFALFIIGAIVAIPFRYVFAKEPGK